MLAQGWLHGLPDRLDGLHIDRCSRPQVLQVLLGLWHCLQRVQEHWLHIKVQRQKRVQVHRQRGQGNVQRVHRFWQRVQHMQEHWLHTVRPGRLLYQGRRWQQGVQVLLR